MTREQFQQIYQQGPEACFLLFEALAQRVAALEDKLAPGPHTPSSAQGFIKPKNQRPKTDRPTGGQKGHKGHTLEKSEKPDKTQAHQPEKCPNCGLNLKDIAGEVVETRQVIDLPEVIRFLTVEHQALQVCCPGCQCQVKAAFPEHVNAPVVYGPNTQATCLVFKMEQAIALKRIVQMISDWFGHSPSVGTIQNWIALASRRLVPVEQRIREGIIQSECAGFDETLVRCANNNFWIHVARTGKLTYFSAPGGRGKVAMGLAGVLPHFKGVALHDALSGYFSFTECEHALCNAHLLREGEGLKDRFDKAGVWTQPILSWLLEIKKSAESGVLASQDSLVAQLRSLVGDGYVALGLSPPCEGEKLSACSKEVRSRVRWLDRLWFYASEVTRFGWAAVKDWDSLTCFDNNGSERDIRPVKMFSKVFGCWRSLSGLADFCRLRSYLSTLRKQGISARAGLLSVFLGNPIVPAIA